MISTIADLLESFRRKELELLDRQHVVHPPTIGCMYEGLTRNILEKALPTNVDLRVVSGFIANNRGDLSRQIDCMLVTGEGEKIPYTEDYQYHFHQVIAVVEVKKNLFSKDLDSAYQNLSSVRSVREAPPPSENRIFRDAYKAIVHDDPYIYADIGQLPLWKRQLGFALHLDSVLPIWVVLGYHGFANELSLRESFCKFLEQKVPGEGYAPADFPNLVICDGYSLIKLNGMPYSLPVINDRKDLYYSYGMYDIDDNAPVRDNMWPVYASYANNPMILLLELIWTRLTYSQKLSDFVFGPDLNMENLKPMLLAKAIEINGTTGWHYECFLLPKEILNKIPPAANWQPIELNADQFTVLVYLLNYENSGKPKGMDIDLPELVQEFQDSKQLLKDAATFLQQVGLISSVGNKLYLLTEECKLIALPDGRVVVGEDASGRFTNWLAKYMTEYGASGE